MKIKAVKPYRKIFRKERNGIEFHCDVESHDGKPYIVTGCYYKNWEFAHALLGSFHVQRFIDSDKFFSEFTISRIC